MRDAVERTFTADDGAEIAYRAWSPTGDRRGAVLLLHRGHEHGGRMAHLADELDVPDHAIYAWDARGHGRSAGERGAAPGFGALVRDLDAWVRHLRDVDGVEPAEVSLVAQSVGAVIAAGWVHDFAPRIRALVLAAPAFSVQLYVPFARPGLRLLRSVFGPFHVTSYVKSRLLTHDRERARTYDLDPLVTRPISVDLLLALADAGERLVADARAITTPTQLLVSGDDWVVDATAQHQFFQNLGAPTKERHVFPGARHDTLGEAERDGILGKVRAFLLAAADADEAPPSHRAAHRVGYTRDESDALSTPLSPWSPRGAWWSVVRGSLALGAHLSTGLRIGARTGFDSGESLDWVYHDAAEGLGPVGRVVDRVYLDQPGWRGIRTRKVHLSAAIGIAAERLRADGLPVRILDVACGHGRVVLDAIEGLAERPERVVLRDLRPENVRAAHALAHAKGQSDVICEVGDAFDPAAFAALDPAPTLVVVSGLYELFGDNDLVARSLDAIGDALEHGGCLVFTGQPWHPQLELIARGLTSHRDGAAWVMRRRTVAELRELVASAGLDREAHWIDEGGLFTVSIARKRAKVRKARKGRAT